MRRGARRRARSASRPTPTASRCGVNPHLPSRRWHRLASTPSRMVQCCCTLRLPDAGAVRRVERELVPGR